MLSSNLSHEQKQDQGTHVKSLGSVSSSSYAEAKQILEKFYSSRLFKKPQKTPLPLADSVVTMLAKTQEEKPDIICLEGGGSFFRVSLLSSPSLEEEVLKSGDREGPTIKTEGGNLNLIGSQKFFELMEHALKEIKFRDDNLIAFIRTHVPTPIIVMCMAGMGSEAKRQQLHDYLVDTIKADPQRIIIGTDVDASLASLRAHGAMLISGTGSVCKGLSAQGQPVQAGGLGAHLSGDPGSAFSAGRYAVIDYLNLKNGSEVFDPETGDFIGKDDPLFSAVSIDLEKRFPDIAALVPHLNAQQAERAQMAELAPMVFEYAFDRQPASRLAKKIVNQVAQELAVQQAEVMVPVLKKDPHLKGIPFKVFLAGGIFESPHGEKFLSLIQEKLESMLKPSWPYVSMKWDYAFAENQTSRMVQNVGSFLLEQQSKNASRSPSLKSAT